MRIEGMHQAYALCDGGQSPGEGGDAFAKDAIRTLLTEVENNRTKCMVVLAGYKEKMDRLMRQDEGLARRFPLRLHLPDYTAQELALVCEIKAKTAFDRILAPGLVPALASHIRDFYSRDIPKQNAGLAVNLTERAVDSQISRLVDTNDWDGSPAESTQASLKRTKTGFLNDERNLLKHIDFGIHETPTLGDAEERQRIRAEVDSLIGMDDEMDADHVNCLNPKKFFDEIDKAVAFVEGGGSMKLLQTSLNVIDFDVASSQLILMVSDDYNRKSRDREDYDCSVHSAVSSCIRSAAS